MEKLSDKALWDLLKKGDLQAFSILFKAFYPLLHSYGLKISKNNVQLTEDCLQDFFVYIYERRENLADLDSIRPYLYASFRRRLLLDIKKSLKLTSLEDYKIDFVFSKEELLIAQETKAFKNENLSVIINKLPTRQKEVLFLKYNKDLSISEIAKVMKINYQSVVNMLHKATKKLREEASLASLLKDILK